MPKTSGEHAPNAKLTEAQAQAILDAQELEPAKVVGERYGVPAGYVREIWNRKRWKHLKRSRPLPSQMEPDYDT